MPMPKLMQNRILARNPEFGGITLLATGTLGSGKTSFICHIARRILEAGSGEVVYWRGDEACQWVKFLDHDPPVPVKLLVPEGKEVEFFGSTDGLPEPVRFSGFRDLVSKADPGAVNVPYLDDFELIDFMTYLQVHYFGWTSVFVDECESLAPYGSSGEKFASARRFGEILKNARKFRMSVYANTQAAQDIYWFVLSKFRAYAFLEGARVLKYCPIWKAAIQALRTGEAWVSTGGLYEKVKFPPYVTRRDVRARISGASGASSTSP